MDSSEVSGSLDPLPLPDKPLIGDLPADMEFGEDLLGSQTASTQEASVLRPPDWDQSKQMTADGDLGLQEKGDGLSEQSKSNDLNLDKPSTALDVLEKPDVLDDLDGTAGSVELNKSEGLDELCKAQPSQDGEGGMGDSSTVSKEALVPETQKEGEGAPKTNSGDLKEDGAAAIPALSDDNGPESPLQPAPDSGDLSSAPATEETTAQPSSPPIAPPQLSLKQSKKTRLKAPRKSSPVQREGLPGDAEVELSPDSRMAALPSEPAQEKKAEEWNADGNNSLRESTGLKAEEAALPAEGLSRKGGVPQTEKEKRSERARRSETARPETVNSAESIPVSDEDSDAMVDDPNDEDFVPFRTRRSTRMSLRTQIAQRAARSSAAKMTCANCRTPLQKGQTAYQRKGLPQLFCSSSCLTTFSKRPHGKKMCTFCKKEIWNTRDSVVAQIGSGGSFHEFCTSVCLSLYEAQQQRPAPQFADPSDTIRCSVCHKPGEVQHEVSNGNVVHRICSDACFTKFRATKGLKTNCCDYCGLYIYNKGMPVEYLFHEGQQKRFCNSSCLNSYKKKNTRVYPCMWCKTLCKNFDMLPNVDRSGKMGLFCSICCTTSHKVKQSGLVGQSSETKPPAPSHQKAETNTLSSKTSSAHMSPAAPPPPPPPVPATPRKNKAAMCKPLMQNRGVSCKVEMKSKGCQTEADWKPQVIVLPIPVPIFVPVPMHMYCQKVPVPFSMPVPVPVPMFLPTTLESADKIVETIEELKVKIPSNPLEADILAMAEMIAEAEELDKASSDLCDLVSNQSAEGLLEDCDLFGPARDDVLAMAVKMANVLDEPGQDLEADFPKNPLYINPSVDFLFDCGLVGPEDVSTEQELPRAVRKGQKRLVLSESCSRDSMSSQPSCTALNYSYGVNAWKSWVQAKYAGGETSKGEELRFGPKPIRIKEDILACTAAELNYGLAQFVKEITRPNGERYEPDSIYYLCLGIQQYLLENNRMVNIFTDLYYLTFVQELNKSLSGWQPTVLPNNTVFSRVEEEHLWECKQLGVYSPFVLLNTLMFFNTKFFGLQTAEEHMQLSFTNVVRQSRKCTTARGVTKMVSIRYCAPAKQKKGRDGSTGKRKREEEMPMLEQRENKMNPLRCPVKFYEFYLSKCPESMRNRSDIFYLQPERSCIAESPLWYSVIPMDRSMLESMLNRILVVREIYEEHSRLSSLEDDMD
ncbi:zinc finger MYM-type protein 3 isoform X3 [Gallus gallus]|uniref:zinc finger MYM-type protein 3 isoform X3 n=1 Tax=Gallus gallus TaxID=9031 RepID=UPI000D63F7F1|nr:zinc finger MYM-type protein 3 isoform X3 [Gallus gallus]|eukprot:XP_025006105.1 zinc finger MYM-type protein 3 isoform X3 [Gallus gallus]